jgi:quercetin dioxygenase-like cupin family protein
MSQASSRPYALKAGEGSTYKYGIDFTVKAGEVGDGPRLAVVEYTTRAGEEPPAHTHGTEDEVFYVLKGDLAFRCGDETYELADGGFIFLPRNIEHGYRIRSEEEVKLLVITVPAAEKAEGGWGGFVADIEMQGEGRGQPDRST